MLKGKNVLLGVSGGIAAYKTPDLVRKLVTAGANVRVVLTQSAQAFVSELSLQAVASHPVSTDLLDPSAEAAMGHIELAKWADILLIAPATANVLGKLANGIADDLLTTLFMATTAQVIIAPAMNQQMWQAPALSRNLALLADDGCQFIGPDSGEQACGDIGPGRMVEPEAIVMALELAEDEHTHLPDMQGKRIVITAGPTQEAIDPVRYMSNKSSGKMGYAIASAAAKAGADVVLISGPVSLQTPVNVTRVDVVSAQDMHKAALVEANTADIFIACAAVADYRPESVAQNKIKKTSDELTLTFVKNPDILKDVAALPTAPFTVGFAAESQNVEEYARKKLAAKKLNMIAANDITAEGLGFNSDNNALHVFWPEGDKQLPAASKRELAAALIGLIATHYNENN
ncbi:bifunctional phosphopantothenoylcysteine decarboxylase/phosphopantothenate--cysteine ligase CoaBC [Alteromonas sediminis]|uniref:bifunctional phosphopantothenoylcysteine decarboxylase/phosphopantothenate--cysteine ligase CoaBC n=1 Tax=Alteromonas sediminis TaxID=2259342 RepID=UPI001F0BE7D7|nr:bifunctional phosphopantothenoylcysteine decarboxylase/phosphopantothenate--cysteine ligase CoaBC [Alteromonas sediminis]